MSPRLYLNSNYCFRVFTMLRRSFEFFVVVVVVSVAAHVSHAEEEDLRSMASETCLLPELEVAPPTPWYSVPIEAGDPGVEGCQLIWEEGSQYMGMMRVVAFETKHLPVEARDVRWENAVLAFEAVILADMGFSVGDVVFRQDDFPVAGPGFSNGKAVRFKLELTGVEHSNEVHYVLFESDRYKYAVSVLTPSKEASSDIYHANTEAMGLLVRNLEPLDRPE